jgi:hypothetical protein
VRSFDQIYEIAAKRKGGPKALEKLLGEHKPKSRGALAKVPDDRWLAGMTRCVEQAFNQWAEESGRDLTTISRTLAMSVGN